MPRAKSRLATDAPVPDKLPRIHDVEKVKKPASTATVPKHLRHWPLLVMSMVSYMVVLHILTARYPEEIKNVLVPNIYLPLQLSILVANFFLLSFLFLSTRRGLLAALCAQTFIFLHLQSVIFTWQLVLLILVFFGTIELSASLITVVTSQTKKTDPPAPVHTPRRSKTSGRRSSVFGRFSY